MLKVCGELRGCFCDRRPKAVLQSWIMSTRGGARFGGRGEASVQIQKEGGQKRGKEYCMRTARAARSIWQKMQLPFLSGDVMNARFFFLRQIFLALRFIFLKMASCLKKRLTRLFSSTIRTVIGSQFVREKWSIALLF